MKRLAVLGTVATFAIASIAAVPRTAHAQLTMQMGNGWSLSFSGNVNAFEVEGFSSGAPANVTYGNVNSAEGTTNRVRTGLLPAFAVFDVKGKEGPLDLGVHFGFAPQIQTGSSCSSSGGTQHDNFGCGTQAGAQIDMRQVYLTLGGSWGQILAGREIGLYQRENILTDMTLTGVGATGGQIGAGGTTLGRIGFGYTYADFNSQVTYSSPATNDVVLSIGLFDPSTLNGESGPAKYTKLPRVEAELTWTGKLGTPAAGAAGDKVLVWVGGTWQEANFLGNTTVDSVTSLTDSTRNAEGVDFGVKLDLGQLSLVGSGYYDKGVGTTLMFTTNAGFDGVGQGADELRLHRTDHVQDRSEVDDRREPRREQLVDDGPGPVDRQSRVAEGQSGRHRDDHVPVDEESAVRRRIRLHGGGELRVPEQQGEPDRCRVHAVLLDRPAGKAVARARDA